MRGRPRKYRGIRVTSFYIPIEFEGLYEKFVELANAERVSISRKILDAIMEYVDLHYPGNPNTIIPPFTGNAPKPVRLRAKFEAEELKQLIRKLESVKDSDKISYGYRYDLEKKVKKLIISLSRLNERLRDSRIGSLVDNAASLVDRSSGGGYSSGID